MTTDVPTPTPSRLSSLTASTKETMTGTDGNTYTLRPLKMRQWGEVEHFVRKFILIDTKRYIDRQEELASLVPEQFRKPPKVPLDQLWAKAQDKAEAMDLMHPEFTSALAAIEPMTHLFYQSLLREHPNVTENLVETIFDSTMMAEFMTKFSKLNWRMIKITDEPDDPQDGEGGQNPTQAANAAG